MFEMSRTLLTVVAVWSLVASPGLCRGGWLTACCEHETTIGFSAGEGGCEDPDCRCPVKEQPKEPTNGRHCAPCAAVCAGLFKPGDDTSVMIDGGMPAQAIVPAYADLIRHASARRVLESSPGGRQRLPFPRSDIPLLI
jgi:hypothetical protein